LAEAGNRKARQFLKLLKEEESARGFLGLCIERLEEKEGDKSNNAIHLGSTGARFAPSFKPSFLLGAHALLVFKNITKQRYNHQ